MYIGHISHIIKTNNKKYMKYLKLFKTESDRDAFLGGGGFNPS